jgi:hypothetical protein
MYMSLIRAHPAHTMMLLFLVLVVVWAFLVVICVGLGFAIGA